MKSIAPYGQYMLCNALRYRTLPDQWIQPETAS